MTIYTTTGTQFSKAGITVSYTDASGAASTQNVTFANKQFSIDSGLNVSAGDAYFAGAAEVHGAAHLDSTLLVDGAATLGNSLAVAGASNLNNTLAVAGAASLNSTLAVAGASNLNNTLAVSGAASLNSTLAVAGASNLNSTLAVAGASNLNNTLAVAGAAALNSTLAVTGAASLNSTLAVADAASMASTLDVTGASHLHNTLQVDGVATMGSTLVVAGQSRLNGILRVAGAASLDSSIDVEGAALMRNTLAVAGSALLNSSLAVTGASNLNSTLAVTGAASLNNTLAVTGAASLNNTLAVTGEATFQNNVVVNGNLTVLGNQTSVNTVNLEVKDNAILIADENMSDTIQSGIMIQYKPVGASAPQYAGLKRRPITGEFVFYKDAVEQMGYNGGSSAATIAIDNANIDILAKNSALASATSALTVANQNVDTAAVAKINAEAAIPAYSGVTAPASLGEYITIDYGTPTQTTSFSTGGFSGWTHLGNTAFFGSNDNSTWSLIANAALNRDNHTATWSAQTYRYLRIVFKSLDSSYWGQSNDRFSFGSGGSMSAFQPSQLSLSAGLTGLHDQNGGSLNLGYFQISFVSGLYHTGYGWSSGTGAYSGSTSTAPTPSGNEYEEYLVSAQPYQAALTAAIAAYNAAAAAKVVAQSNVTSANADVLAAQTALVAANQLAASSAGADGAYATVLADGFNCASDARLKKDVVALEGALDKIDSIRGVHYHWIDASQPQSRQVGVIAQEIQAAYPELVMEGGNGFLSVDYPKLTAVLIQSVKELKAMVLALANK
jgi:hypothetical protein